MNARDLVDLPEHLRELLLDLEQQNDRRDDAVLLLRLESDRAFEALRRTVR